MNDIEKSDWAWCIAAAQFVSAQDLRNILNQVMRTQHPETVEGRNSQWNAAVQTRVDENTAEHVFDVAVRVAARRALKDADSDDPKPLEESPK